MGWGVGDLSTREGAGRGPGETVPGSWTPPAPRPGVLTANSLLLQYPEGYLEARARKEKEKENSKREAQEEEEEMEEEGTFTSPRKGKRKTKSGGGCLCGQPPRMRARLPTCPLSPPLFCPCRWQGWRWVPGRDT